jgi:hypothetical protein
MMAVAPGDGSDGDTPPAPPGTDPMVPPVIGLRGILDHSPDPGNIHRARPMTGHGGVLPGSGAGGTQHEAARRQPHGYRPTGGTDTGCPTGAAPGKLKARAPACHVRSRSEPPTKRPSSSRIMVPWANAQSAWDR